MLRDVCVCVCVVQLGPNADLKKWDEEQMKIAEVKFGAKDAKAKNKVRLP